MRYEYQTIEKQGLGKRGIENLLGSLGADGFLFSFETNISYVFVRQLPEELVSISPAKKPTRTPKT
jgi:hypothetical protein